MEIFADEQYKTGRKSGVYLKKNKHWNEVRDLYIDKKNWNDNLDKRSRSLYAEAINEIYLKYRTMN